MDEQKLYMLLLGCTPPGRHTEQHDIFFCIGASLTELVPAMKAFWPGANGKIHIDAWREVTQVGEFSVRVTIRGPGPVDKGAAAGPQANRLFFINLGGYKPNEFEEYHYKLIAVGADKGVAIKQSKETAFYKHVGFKGATSHIDDKYGIDVDDAYEIMDILPATMKERFALEIAAAPGRPEDEMHLGYLKLSKLEEG
jgi:hypothetical protein